MAGEYGYAYDVLNRLVETDDPHFGVTSYEYDTLGNLVRKDGPCGETLYTYNEFNQLLTKVGDRSQTTYDYDDCGNLMFTREQVDGADRDTFYEYDPTYRFLSVDPMKDGMNLYVYCLNNPILFVDHGGMETVKVGTTELKTAHIAANGYMVADVKELIKIYDVYYFSSSPSLDADLVIWTFFVNMYNFVASVVNRPENKITIGDGAYGYYYLKNRVGYVEIDYFNIS